MLLFKRKFLEPIRRGEKTQTIRLWKYRKMKPGQQSYVPGVGYIRIETVDPVELHALTDEDARPDGFPTADALRAEIAALYAKYPNRDQQAFRIRFAVLDSSGQQNAAERRIARKHSHVAAPNSPIQKQPAPVSQTHPQSTQPPQTGSIPRPKVPLPAEGFPIR